MALHDCHECGHKISNSAQACPNCGAPKKKSGGVLGPLALVFVVVIIIAGMMGGSDDSPKSHLKKPSPSTSKTVSPQLERVIQEWVKSGAVHSMNVEFNEVRVDPLIWIPLPLENKQNFVTMFSRYFDAKGSTARVDVLSNRNDKKLATYSVWGGIKIIE